jgi:hypothetical protein
VAVRAVAKPAPGDGEERGRSAERPDGEGSIHDLASMATTFAATSTEFLAEGQQRCKLFVNLAQIIKSEPALFDLGHFQSHAIGLIETARYKHYKQSRLDTLIQEEYLASSKHVSLATFKEAMKCPLPSRARC